MPIPSTMADLSITAASNFPAGSESPTTGDDYLRAYAAILRTTNAKGADIASATTTDIGAATGEFVDVTGTTTITGLGTIAAGIKRTVRFTGALTLTHNATSLILPGSANITTANGDVAQFISLGSGNWKCTGYIRQNGGMIGKTLSDQLNFAPTVSIASAATVNIGAAASNDLIISGTTTITAFDSIAAGAYRWVKFSGALTLTHNSTSLILPTGANITTAADDEALFKSLGSGNWKCAFYQRKDGTSLVGGTTYASNAEYVTGTETAKALNPAVARARNLVAGTVIPTTSGTSHDVTGLPAWVKRITVELIGVSTSGTSNLMLQIGDSGGIENTGYVGVSGGANSGNAITVVSFTTGFGLTALLTATNAVSGIITLTLADPATNTWTVSGNFGNVTTNVGFFGTAGQKPLSATLDRIRLTTVNGTDTFDAGSFNIIYE
jgi:hypothetical protein